MDIVYRPDGYNIGYNIYKCVGQDMEHLHFHLYPRYDNEVCFGKGIGYLIAQKKIM